MNVDELWQAVLAELELSLSKANFGTWFRQTAIMSFEDGTVRLCVPNTFTQSWLEKKYHHLIIKSVERLTGKPVRRLEYKIDQLRSLVRPSPLTLAETAKEIGAVRAAPPGPAPGGGLIINSRYTFASFVVGKGSELAMAAAQAVAARPGTAYNPLFLYGSVGLGKTHLLQAIGNALLNPAPPPKILYVNAEKFSNDYVAAVREKTIKEFHLRYRSLDLLLIDDIQFISGKDGTQEAFFHTFNELHQQNRQIVITSDRPPKAIPALEERLRSRFEWGMIVDITLPDFETRVAILERKCAERGRRLPEKVLHTIAASVQNNIRELEGVLNKILAYHDLKHLEPSPESVKALLSATNASSRSSLTPQQILEQTSQFYNLTREEIIGKNREKKISLPRQIIMFLLREELKMSFPAIGNELGGRDHTTAMHAYEKITREVEDDLRLKQEVEMIKQRLYVNNI